MTLAAALLFLLLTAPLAATADPGAAIAAPAGEETTAPAAPGTGDSGAITQPLPETALPFTLWPFIDYRPGGKLSLLGPLVTVEQVGGDAAISVRPLVHREGSGGSSATLLPFASLHESDGEHRFRALGLLQSDGDGQMLFPFYVSGTSPTHGPYRSLFPIHGDLYGRFYRDEYHYLFFPLYSRTVNKGATTTSLLWPFLSRTSGGGESGYRLWPFFGQSGREGVYSSTFALWPLFLHERKGLDTPLPSTRLTLFPLYSSLEAPGRREEIWLWPLFGHRVEPGEEEWDFLWPFWRTVRGERRQVTSLLPFYSTEKTAAGSKEWLLWPLFKSETLDSATFSQKQHRLLYYLYSDSNELWKVDGATRQRSALWPLYRYARDVDGSASLAIPAPVETILEREMIEKNLAPLWRLYDQKWRADGGSSLSLLWNLYWHDLGRDAAAGELFPLVGISRRGGTMEIRLLKGAVSYRSDASGASLRLLWLPWDISW